MDVLRLKPSASAGAVWRWIVGLQSNQEAQRAKTVDVHAGCVPTPPDIAARMARRLLQTRSASRSLHLLDAGCGTATLLTAAVREACRKNLEVDARGIEQDLQAAHWAAGLKHLLHRAAGRSLRSWAIDHSDFLLDDHEQTYDLIISNPPYVTLRSLPVAQRQLLQQRHACGGGDLAVLFVNRMLDLLRPGGRLCVIVPNKLLATNYAEPLRRRLLTQFQLREIHDLSRSKTFPGVGAYPVILVIDRSAQKKRIQVREADMTRRSLLAAPHVLRLPGALLPLDFPATLIEMVNRLRQKGTFGDAVPLHCGIAVSGFGRAIGSGPERIIQSGDVRRFQVRPPKAFDPLAAGIDPRRLERQRVEKIVVPGMFQELCAARSPATDLLGRVYYVPLTSPDLAERRRMASLLLALLNSRFYRVLYRGLFDAVAQAGGWLRLNGPYLGALPWPDAAAGAELVSVAERAERADSPLLRRRLDALVEDLFRMTTVEKSLLDELGRKQRWNLQKTGPEPSRQVAPGAR